MSTLEVRDLKTMNAETISWITKRRYTIRTGSGRDRVKTIFVGVALRGHPSLGCDFLRKLRCPEDGVATECHRYNCFHTVSVAGGYAHEQNHRANQIHSP